MEVGSRLEESLQWYTRIKGFFAPFKPDARHVSMNHRNKTCEIRLHIHVPDSVRRSVAKIEIPAMVGFKVVEIIDEGFSYIPNAFYLDGDKWKLNTQTLPASEHYLITLEGSVDPKVVTSLVRIQPAKNRDQTDNLDRYWLDSMIRDVELLQDIWRFMEVQDIDVDVNVSVERCFADILPADVNERLQATAKYLDAGKTIDRGQQFRAWLRYRESQKRLTVDTESLVRVARGVLNPEDFRKYLAVDEPYTIGSVTSPLTPSQNVFPDQVVVEATTHLDYKKPGATGYLSFNKKLFTEVVRDQLSSIL